MYDGTITLTDILKSEPLPVTTMSYVMRYSRSQPQPTVYIWNNKTLELTSIVTHTPMFYTAMEFTYIGTLHQSLRCLKTRNKLKTKKWTQTQKWAQKLKNGQLTLVGPIFGEVKNCTPHSSFFGPGGIAQRRAQVGR